MTTSTHVRIDESAAFTTEHAWVTESRHATSLGTLLYVRCVSCGARRVDLHASADAAPEGVSRVLPPTLRA